jgi:hypothetical protein
MFRRNHLDDDTVERLLAHQPVHGQEMLVSFVEDVTHATTDVGPVPAPALTSLFAAGVLTDKGDLLVTAGSNVHGPAPQVAGLPKRKKRNVIEAALGKLAALGLIAKLAAATGAVALAGTAIAATGQLPAPAQERAADVAAHVGLSLPGATATSHTDTTDTGTTDPTTSTTTHPDNHGADVSTAAHDHSQDELCGNHGKAVSAVASGQTSCVETTPTTEAGSTTSTTQVQGDDHGKADQHDSATGEANSDAHKAPGDETPTTPTSVPTGDRSGHTDH